MGGSRVASIGECMIELSEHPDGRLTRSFGGDTLNTAVYLARLGIAVDYITALGDDPFSDELIAAWQREGVGTEAVLRLSGRMPGLYFIQTDAKGERRFSYWRDRAAARDLFAADSAGAMARVLDAHSHIYFSGISLSLYGPDGRARLNSALDRTRERGTTIVFDTNFRVRGWPVLAEARAAYTEALARASLVFASVEDLEPIFGPDVRGVLQQHAPQAEIVLKLRHPAVEIVDEGGAGAVEIAAPTVANVIDTTAAGDSFAAAYLAARIWRLSPREAAAFGHCLASTVVQHRGAVIPLSAMPPMPSRTPQ